MKQKRILIPTDGPETWQRFLAEPEKHWQKGEILDLDYEDYH